MNKLATLDGIAWLLVMIGAINWGLYGLFRFNLIEAILGTGFISRLIFIFVGAAAGYLIYLFFKKNEKI